MSTGNTVTLSYLRENSRGRGEEPIVGWLRSIDVVPKGYVQLGVFSQLRVKLNLDPNAIPKQYLTDLASEWDSWGASTPDQFLDALEVETVGSQKRDLISETLEALGRSISQETA